MIDRNDKLLIFEEFQADTHLPKFQKNTGKLKGESSKGEYLEGESSEYSSNISTNITWAPDMGNVVMSANPFPFRGGFRDSASIEDVNSNFKVTLKPFKKRKSFLDKISFWKKAPAPEEAPKEISIAEFFSSVKNSAKEISVIEDRAKGYEQALHRAKQTGQVALLEQLMGGLNAHKMEAQLVALELNKYIEEEDIVKFYKQSKKGLRLDWVRNFARTIPQSVVDKKVHADELEIFDNYAVLHYDPQAKSYAETQAQKDARKDPILFGLMRNRRKLYFVGDWVDELCDLTLDQIAETLGAETIKEV